MPQEVSRLRFSALLLLVWKARALVKHSKAPKLGSRALRAVMLEHGAEISSGDGGTTLRLSLDEGRPRLELVCNDGGRVVLSGRIGGLPRCDAKGVEARVTQEAGVVRVEYAPHGAQILVSHAGHGAFAVDIQGADGDPLVEVAFDLRHGGSWFGLGHIMWQQWPLEQGVLELGPFYPFDNGPNGVCTLIDPTFISTAGGVVMGDDTSHCLHVGLNATVRDESGDDMQRKPLKWGTGVANFDRMILPRADTEGDGDGLLRLQSRAAYDWPHVLHPWLVEESAPGRRVPELRLVLGGEVNVRGACDSVLARIKAEMGLIKRSSPPIKMMEKPIWSTWARYKDAVTQKDVLDFAAEIASRGLPRSCMEIDDRWSVKYGDLEFDRVKFPDPAEMIRTLHELGFFVTLWVIPFANTDSEAVTNPASREYFVQTHTDGALGEFDWWQPTRVAALDVMNEKACAWFVSGLQRLCSKYGVDGFKFDAGEPSFLPADSKLSQSMKCPSDYTRAWINGVASKFPLSEVRAGVRGCQAATPMFRLFDRFSTWGLENGLASVLAALLTSGVLGYPFCIPDYIAGNCYGDDVPDAELMIRWVQANSAMPAMQFSVAPWSLSKECELRCNAAMQWREEFFWAHIESCIEGAFVDYQPIARPMWWAEPTVEGIAHIYDQFLIGNDVVVAPVVQKGQRSRRVFLPSGSWRRVNLSSVAIAHNGDTLIMGPCWLEDVPAPLDDMPTFARNMHPA